MYPSDYSFPFVLVVGPETDFKSNPYEHQQAFGNFDKITGEVEASNTPTIRRLTLSRRHQLSLIAPPVSLLLAELPGEEHDWQPVNYYEEVQPFAIRRSSLKRS